MIVPAWVQRVTAAAGAAGYALVAVHVLADGSPAWASRVLAAVTALLAVTCLLVCVVGRLAGSWWSAVVASANTVSAAFAIAYDLTRTPVPQWLLDAGFAAIVLIEVTVLAHLFARPTRPPNPLVLLVIPALAVLGTWVGAASTPATIRPQVELTASFGAGTTIDDTSGHPDHVAVSATVTVRNAGAAATQVAGSFFTVTALTSASPSRPIDPGTASAFEHDIVTAIGAAQALDGAAANRHLLSGVWPTADPAVTLLQLDEIIPPGAAIAPHTTYTRTISVDVPLLFENPITTLEFRGAIVAAPAGLALRPCPTTTAVVSCATTPLPSAGPLGSWLADRPALRLFVSVGDRSVPGSEAGVLLAGFSPGATPTDLHTARLQRYASVAVDTTEATREVNALATP